MNENHSAIFFFRLEKRAHFYNLFYRLREYLRGHVIHSEAGALHSVKKANAKNGQPQKWQPELTATALTRRETSEQAMYRKRHSRNRAPIHVQRYARQCMCLSMCMWPTKSISLCLPCVGRATNAKILFSVANLREFYSNSRNSDVM